MADWQSLDPEAAREAEKYENPIPSRELILKHLDERGSPAAREELADEFGMATEEQLEALRRRLRAMERDGQLIYTRRGTYAPVDKLDLILGRVSGHRDGFGFLVPDDGSDDLFLSPAQMRLVFDGDRALARVSGLDRRGRVFLLFVVEGFPLRHTAVDALHLGRAAPLLQERVAHPVGLGKAAARGVHRDAGAQEALRGLRRHLAELVGHGAGGFGVTGEVRGHHQAVDRHRTLGREQQHFRERGPRPIELLQVHVGQAQELLRDPVARVDAQRLLVTLQRHLAFLRVALAGLQVVDEAVEKMQVRIAWVQLQRFVHREVGLGQFQALDEAHRGGDLGQHLGVVRAGGHQRQALDHVGERGGLVGPGRLQDKQGQSDSGGNAALQERCEMGLHDGIELSGKG